ncbi:hypothetical protein ACIGZJ_27565 [Kitasatospora sp. NPDC052868]|uniref:hypothetical protein n=1 Tax=Kitasatospora sp. NPDC052868 TaxID=3364060 RepID=UPI0037CB061A
MVSFAWPIRRTSDLGEALRLVTGLLALADTSEMTVALRATVDELPVLHRVQELVGALNWWTLDKAFEISSFGHVGARPEDHLPVVLDGEVDSAEAVAGFLDAVRSGAARLTWDFAGWPAMPEAGLGSTGERCAFVTLVKNATDLDLRDASAGHVVFVHAIQHEEIRARMLAARVGCEVLGEGHSFP